MNNKLVGQLRNITYKHRNGDLLFEDINLTLNTGDKAALIGNNGVGKSTLLKLLAGKEQHYDGTIQTTAKPYFVPQIFGQYNEMTIAEALQIDGKLQALHEILAGNTEEENFTILNDDWNIEERCQIALNYWQLDSFALTQRLGEMSGGQKTKVFLSGISINQAEFVLLDEPSNHLDAVGHGLLKNFIQSYSGALLIVSHDRELLNLLGIIYELKQNGIKVYGGNYEFYKEQKQIENNALNEDVRSKEKQLRRAKEIARETTERQQKSDAHAKKNKGKAGLPAILLGTRKNNAEKTAAKLQGVHLDKTSAIAQELSELRKGLSDIDAMKFGFDNSTLHRGKVLVLAKGINFCYSNSMLWEQGWDIHIVSGERIAICGTNGSGKTTLIKILLGELQPSVGNVLLSDNKSVYIDQDYSLINNSLSVYEQSQQFNVSALLEHEIKIRLARFLFMKEDWDKKCSALSGGEKMRLMLCCLTIGNKSPDIIILDEPTNNLDIQNLEILTSAINEYQGTLIVVSHDQYFLKQINIEREIII